MRKSVTVPAEMKDRKVLFEGLNEYVRARHGWLISILGAREVTMERLHSSTLPDDLRALGYTVEANGQGERVLTNEIIVIGPGGGLEPAMAGSRGRSQRP
jgi:hypothetical protein